MANKSRAPIEPKAKERCAELRGLGLTQEECAGALDISRASVDRIMSQPEYRKIADDIQRSRTSMRAEVRSVLHAALTACDSDGQPLYSVRQRAAEALAKSPDLLTADEDEGEAEALPGVTMIFPLATDAEVEPGTIQVRTEDGTVVAEVTGVEQREDSTLPEDEERADAEAAAALEAWLEHIATCDGCTDVRHEPIQFTEEDLHVPPA